MMTNEEPEGIKLMPVVSEDEEPAGVLADFMIKTKYEDLPADTVLLYKTGLLDTVAVNVGGANEDGVTQAREMMVNWGGKPEARILVHGDKLPLQNAAFVNGVAARALDFGDVGLECSHSSEWIVPAIISAADAVGGVSGKEFLATYVLASEINFRIGMGCLAMTALDKQLKLPTIHTWPATCGVARILGLDVDQTWNAMGLAYSCLSSGDVRSTVEGNMVKRMQHAWACQDAVTCSLLAKAGVTGTKGIFFGVRGYLATNYPFQNDPEKFTKDLGTEWLARFNRKLYTCCMMIQGPIRAALEVVEERNVEVDNIELMEFEILYEPCAVPEKWDPKTVPEAQFSLPYVVATALIKGKVFMDDYTPQEMRRGDVRALMAKIKGKAVSQEQLLGYTGANLKMTLKDGTVYKHNVAGLWGSIENPLTWEQVVTKLHVCAKYVGMPSENQDKIINMVKNIENVIDMREMIDLLVLAK